MSRSCQSSARERRFGFTVKSEIEGEDEGRSRIIYIIRSRIHTQYQENMESLDEPPRIR